MNSSPGVPLAHRPAAGGPSERLPRQARTTRAGQSSTQRIAAAPATAGGHASDPSPGSPNGGASPKAGSLR
eukprot:2001263-Prymnesium_polylepis.1